MLNPLEENSREINNDSSIQDHPIDRFNALDDYDRSDLPDGDDEFSYQSLPPKRSFTVKARIRFGGRMQPLPYDFDE
jgi:hypothetical protein